MNDAGRKNVDGRAMDALQRAREWDRCWPGNVNVETLVNDFSEVTTDLLHLVNRSQDEAADRRASAYVLLEGASPSELQAVVREHLAQGWRLQGNPFTYSWAPGHGTLHAGPSRSDNFDGWVYQAICQAMVL